MKRYLRAFCSKVGRRAAFSFVLGACLFALGLPAPTQASTTYYHFWGAPTGPLTFCNQFGNQVAGPVNLNVIAGLTYSMVPTLNGISYGPFTGTYNAPYTGPSGYQWGWFPATFTFPYPAKWAFTLKAADGTPLTLSTISFTCAAPGVITNLVVTNIDLTVSDSWNPDDGRVDPHPGDRLAVWCNQPDKVVVYGIADDLPQDKSGFHLATFSYSGILAAGDRGLTVRAGANGTVSVSIRNGWFWIAWNGGKYHATGQGIFVKNFEDAKWCPGAHPAQ
jgi:hypothetical protein